MNMRVDTRTNFFVMIPAPLVWDSKSIDHLAVRVYGCLRDYADWKDGTNCFPAQETIAKELGVRRETINRKIAKLRKMDYVRVQHSIGKSNRYTFPLEERWRKSHPNAHTDTSPVMGGSHYRDTVKEIQNKGTFTKKRLRHGSEMCSVLDDGTIKIGVTGGDWKFYAGGDDERFRFGDLIGTEAKMAAIKSFVPQSLPDQHQDSPLDENQDESPYDRPDTTPLN